MEAVYRDTRGGVALTEGGRPGEIDFYPRAAGADELIDAFAIAGPADYCAGAAPGDCGARHSSGSTSARARSASTSTSGTRSGSGARSSRSSEDDRAHGARGPARRVIRAARCSESDFEIVEAPVGPRRAGPGARPQHVDVRRPRASAAAARARARGVLRRLPAAGADGRDHDGRRGGRVARRGVRAGRHRLARVRLARLRGRHRRRGGAPRRSARCGASTWRTPRRRRTSACSAPTASPRTPASSGWPASVRATRSGSRRRPAPSGASSRSSRSSAATG